MEPDFEVEGGAGVAGGVEQAEGDAAVDAAAEEDGDPELLARHGAGKIGVEVAIGGRSWRLGELGGGGERDGEGLDEDSGDGGGERTGPAEREDGGGRSSGGEEGGEDDWSRDEPQHRHC